MKNLFAVIVCLLVMCHAAVDAQTNAWSPVGTNGGPMKNDTRDLAGGTATGGTQREYLTDASGLYYSTNSGPTWTWQQTTYQPAGLGRRVACLPTDYNQVIVAADNNMIYKSTDGGATNTWDGHTDATNQPMIGPHRIAVSPANNQIVWIAADRAGGSSSLWKSADFGAHWSQDEKFQLTNYPQVNLQDILFDPISSQKAWVCGVGVNTLAANNGVWFTSDGGINWNQRSTGITTTSKKITALGRKVDPVAGKTWLFAAFVNKLCRSSDEGISWSSTGVTGLTNVDTIRVILGRTDSDTRVYLATDHGVYVSSDYGLSWSESNGNSSSPLFDPKTEDLLFDPSVSNTMYSAGTSQDFVSTDAGTTWNTATGGFTLKSVSTAAAYAGSVLTGSLSDNTDGTFSSSTWQNHGIAFADVALAIQNVRILSSSNNAIATGSVDNKATLYYTSNALSSSVWTQEITGTSNLTKLNGTMVLPNGNIFAFGESDMGSTSYNFYQSTNQGVTWTPILPAISTSNPARSMTAVSSQILLAGLDVNGIWRSLDGGNTWPYNPLPSRYIYGLAVNPGATGTVYAGGRPSGGNSMWKSTDQGAAWSNTSPARTDTVKRIVMDPRFSTSDKSLYIVARANGGNDQIYRSMDGTASWSSAIMSGLPSGVGINDLQTDPSDNSVLYIATTNGVYKGQMVTSPNSLSATLSCFDATFSWTAPSKGVADSYHLQISSNGFISIDYDIPGITGLSYVKTVLCNKTYSWRVSATSALGESPYTTASSGLTTPLCQPNVPDIAALSSPSDQQQNVSTGVTLTWNAAARATKYRVQLGNNNFSVIYRDAYTSGVTYGVSGLAYSTTYYWHVKSLNCTDSTDYVNGPTWAFTTEPDPCPPPCNPHSTIPQNPEDNARPTAYALAQNFPNPFNPTTQFKYAIPFDAHVSLTVYDVLGREVAVLVNGFQTAGYKSIDLDASHLPSGVYFYRLSAGRFTDIKKMILMR